MHARVTLVPIKGAERSEAGEFAEEATKVLGQFPGFQSATYLMNDDMSELGIISFWGTKEQATANSDALRAALVEGLEGYLTGQPTTKIFEVYEKVPASPAD